MTPSARPAYFPQPIPLDGIEVGDDLSDLIESLARNAHDVWALQRFADGWIFGEKRCDDTKTNPCLVDYDELPEGEKLYDRKIVTSTLRAMIALGYSVSKIA
jgi:RyR domain